MENISALTDDDLKVLQRLVQIGVQICIDDCGALESANHLNKLVESRIPIHTLKIDGSETVTVLDTPQNVIGWGRIAEKIGAKEVIFEGSYPKVLTPGLIDRLKEARDLIRSRVPWYVEGPVFPDSDK